MAWMGIELKGTNAVVKIVKASSKPNIIDENEYCNIVANKSGIITKINAQNGTANVKVGDTIKEGEILINGWMEGKYTGVRYVHAKGEIEAKVWYTESKKIPYILTQTRQTGNIENKYIIKINNFEINFSKKYSKFKIYDTIETDSKFKIFSNFYLPISLATMVLGVKDLLEANIGINMWACYLFCMIITSIITYFSTKWFNGIMKTGKLIYFVWYCLIVGSLVIIFL